LALATTVAEKGATVTLIDADPNRPIQTWEKGGAAPRTMRIVSDVTEEDIADRIDEAARESTFVFVDLEGTAATIVAHAISEADFAGRAFRLIRAHERGIQKHKPDYRLPYAVLFTRTAVAIQSRDTSHIRKTFAEANIPVFNVELNERAAFKAMFSYRQTLSGLSRAEVSNVDKAIENIEALAAEVIQRLKDSKQQESEVTQ
jgi:chromosome partitioning protein